MIRAARPDDLPLLRDVEVRAGALFREIGMDDIAGDDPGELDPADTVFVAEHERAIVGYVHVLVVDDGLHVEQVSVVPEAAGRRIGAALIHHAEAHARQLGLDRLTLTTFTDVPWNQPYYERIGFRVLEALGPELTALVEHEEAAIPGNAPRVSMVRPL